MNKFYVIVDNGKSLCTNRLGESFFRRGISSDTRVYESCAKALKDIKKIRSRRSPNKKYSIVKCNRIGESIEVCGHDNIINENWLDGISGGFKKAFGGVGDAIGGIASGVGDVVGGVGNVVGAVGSGVGSAVGGLANGAANMINGIGGSDNQKQTQQTQQSQPSQQIDPQHLVVQHQPLPDGDEESIRQMYGYQMADGSQQQGQQAAQQQQGQQAAQQQQGQQAAQQQQGQQAAQQQQGQQAAQQQQGQQAAQQQQGQQEMKKMEQQLNDYKSRIDKLEKQMEQLIQQQYSAKNNQTPQMTAQQNVNQSSASKIASMPNFGMTLR